MIIAAISSVHGGVGGLDNLPPLLALLAAPLCIACAFFSAALFERRNYLAKTGGVALGVTSVLLAFGAFKLLSAWMDWTLRN